MVRILGVVIAVFFAALQPSTGHTAALREFVGTEYLRAPEGCTPVNGRGDLRNRKLLHWVRCGAKNYELLSELRYEGTQPIKRVLAAHLYPPVPKGFKISAEDHCSDAKKANDQFLFAIVRWKDRKDGMYASEIRYAWRADLETNQFVRLNPKTVKCSFLWP